MLVITHNAVEEIDIENFIGLIWLENYHVTSNVSARYLNYDLLQSLMKISQHLFKFLNNFDVKICLKFDYMLRNSSLNLNLCSCLRLECFATFKVRVVTFLDIL